jgi:hypothetical protein
MLSLLPSGIDTGEGPKRKDEAQSYLLESDWVLQLTPIPHELGKASCTNHQCCESGSNCF